MALSTVVLVDCFVTPSFMNVHMSLLFPVNQNSQDDNGQASENSGGTEIVWRHVTLAASVAAVWFIGWWSISNAFTPAHELLIVDNLLLSNNATIERQPLCKPLDSSCS